MKISNNAFTQTWCYVSHYCCPECLIPGSSWSSAVHHTCCYQHKKKTAGSHYFLFLKTLPTLISYFLCVYSPTPCYTLPQLTFSRWHCKISQLPRACTHWGNTRVSCPAVRGACIEWAAGQVLYTHHYHGWWVMGCHWGSELVIKVYQVWGGGKLCITISQLVKQEGKAYHRGAFNQYASALKWLRRLCSNIRIY